MANFTFDELINALQTTSSSDDQLSEIARELLILGDESAIGPLFKRLTNNQDSPWVRRELVVALGGLLAISDAKSPEMSQAIADLFLKILLSISEADEVKEASALALGTVKAKQAVLPLIQSLESGTSRLAYACIVALGLIGDPTAIDILIRAIEWNDILIPQAAAKALSEFGSVAYKAVPYLEGLANRGNVAERQAALEAIHKIRAN